MDNITLGVLIILTMAVLFLYLDQFNIVDIAPKSSGFNNPDGYPRHVIIQRLENNKNVYKTDYNDVIIDILLKKPRHEVDIYFQKSAEQYEGMRKRGQLSQDLLVPPLDNQQEITRYRDFKMMSINRAPIAVSVPPPVQTVPTSTPPVQTVPRTQKTFSSWGWGRR